jgi:hypothetical protein
MRSLAYTRLVDPIPDDFARQLADLIQPEDRSAVGEIIATATTLDDRRLRAFLDLFAERVRESAAPITRAEMDRLLREARRGPASWP